MKVRLIWCPYDRDCVGRVYEVWLEDGDWLYVRAIVPLAADPPRGAEPANRLFLRSMVQPALEVV